MNKTLWKAVQYGKIGNDICRISEWRSYMPNDAPKRFTLHPLDGGAPHCGLREGEFTRYTESENQAVRNMLAEKQNVPQEYEPVWKD
jgi:hypothetical protein